MHFKFSIPFTATKMTDDKLSDGDNEHSKKDDNVFMFGICLELHESFYIILMVTSKAGAWGEENFEDSLGSLV